MPPLLGFPCWSPCTPSCTSRTSRSLCLVGWLSACLCGCARDRSTDEERRHARDSSDLTRMYPRQRPHSSCRSRTPVHSPRHGLRYRLSHGGRTAERCAHTSLSDLQPQCAAASIPPSTYWRARVCASGGLHGRGGAPPLPGVPWAGSSLFPFCGGLPRHRQ